MIKDLLILLSIDQERGWVLRRNAIAYALLAATFYDLATRGYFSLESGRIQAKPGNTGDPVLDELADRLTGMQGKRYSWGLNRFTMRLNGRYRMQMQHLEQKRLISSRPVEWLGITWGKRYRVNRIDSLKPLITEFERVLIYGSEPSLNTRLLIELLGTMDLLRVFFRERELRTRARKRYREISRQDFPEQHPTLSAIRKEFRNALRAAKAQAH